MKRSRPQPQDYTIGWITALHVEFAAASRMLDEEHNDPLYHSHHGIVFKYGRIGVHNVVLACLPAGQYGTQAAATTTTWMRSTFPSLELGLLVGIGGGVPSKYDIRLGDVVVSQPSGTYGGVVQHDSGKIISQGQLMRTGFLNSPHPTFLNALNIVKANHVQGKFDFLRYLSAFQNLPGFDRDTAGPDILFEAACEHQGGESCHTCTNIVIRPTREGQKVVVHYGTIASGDQVIKDGVTRDAISEKLGDVLCFEMEAAGLMNSFPCLVIRGICDYADSHKNKKWQGYAAATAASFAKEILSVVPAVETIHRHLKFDFAKLSTARGASFDSHEEEHNATCLNNTRSELQRQIKEWADAKHSKYIFWLNGMAGTGKSTIARTVARTFRRKGQLGASFFFKRGEGDRGKAARFFPTIASDLVRYIPDLAGAIDDALHSDPDIPERALKDQFEQLILKPLSSLRSMQVASLIIVIDALDECDNENDIKRILQLLAQANDIKPTSLRILVTSRPEQHIRWGFRQMADGTYQDLILHNIPKTTIEHDIDVFVRHELINIRKERGLPEHWPKDNDIKHLIQMAAPLFIFAATACRFIGEIKSNPRKRLERILHFQADASISKLDKTYHPILSYVFDGDADQDIDKDFRQFVGAIVVLASPLSIIALSRLLAREKEDISCILDPLHSVLSIPNDENVPIRLLHLSFRDFLLDPQKRGRSQFWVDEGEVHETLLEKCLQLLSANLKQDMCDLRSPGVLASEISSQIIDSHLPPEIQYACRYWAYHLQHSQEVNQELLMDFLQTHILHWMEAMSLLGYISEAIQMVRILNNHKQEDRGKHSFVHDIYRFILRNRHMIEQAPMQVYISGLIFSPEASIVRKVFESNIPAWIGLKPKVEKGWTAGLQTLEGHLDSVTALAFSPDGQLLASGSMDETVRLWDPATGQCTSTLEAGSAITALAFLLNGQLLASGSVDNIVRLWDPATSQYTSTPEGHSDSVIVLASSPDGKLLASGSNDRTVRLWDPATRHCTSILEGHSREVTVLAFSPNGQLLASGSEDNTVRLWDLATGQCASTLEYSDHSRRVFYWVTALAFLPNGQLLVSSFTRESVQLWDLATGQCTSTLKGLWEVAALASSPNGKLLASIPLESNSTVQLWDRATGQLTSTLEGHTEEVRALAFSLDGQLLASGSEDNMVRLWDPATSQYESTPEGHRLDITALAFSPKGQLLASGSMDETVRLWDPATGQCISTLEAEAVVTALAFSLDGKLLASGCEYESVLLWDLDKGQCINELEPSYQRVIDLAFLPDSQSVSSSDDNVCDWDPATSQHISKPEDLLNPITALAFSPDGGLLVSSSDNKLVRLWDLAAGQCSTIELNNSISMLSFSPDGTSLKTDRGRIQLNLAVPIPYCSPPSSFSFFIQNNWICNDRSERLIWLPPHLRVGISAVRDNFIVIVHSSVHLSFFSICNDLNI